MISRFDARIEGRQILCRLIPGQDMARPSLCLSLLHHVQLVEGGSLLQTRAGFAEILLPPLRRGQEHQLRLAYAHPDFYPRNRAWLPMGVYLKEGRDCHPVELTYALGPRTAPPQRPDNAPPPPPPPRAGDLPLVPPVAEWAGRGGWRALGPLRADPRLAGADALARRAGLAPLVAGDGTAPRFQLRPELAGEAYEIDIDADQLTLRAAGQAGFHLAAMTLLSLRELTGDRLPLGVIRDHPRFAWRGLQLDCARHYYSTDFILRLLDVMAWCKLNRFHWHFADDEAFRLQVTCYPGLWQSTEFRGEGCAIPGVFGGGQRAGGSYSRQDVARILARAADLGIEVLPEVEIPAHSHAMIRVLPGLRDPGDNGEEVSVQGYSDNVINPGIDSAWQIMTRLTEEVADWFPIRMLHLGCDEAPHGAWSRSPAVQALKAREGLHSSEDVQGWMMARLAAQLARKGIRTAAWEEAARGANGGIGHGALLFSWTGQGPGVEAARRGYDVVMCPAAHTYFDLAPTGDGDDWGLTWAGEVSLARTVTWDPVPAGCEDIAPRVLGVEGCLWGETILNDAMAEAMIAPRILGLACKGWERRGRTDGPAIETLAAGYRDLFARIGWAWHSHPDA